MGSKRKAKFSKREAFEPHLAYKRETLEAAEQLNPLDVYDWLVTHGYYPESYVLPPAFRVTKHPKRKIFFPLQNNGKRITYVVPEHDLVTVHFPRTEMTDRHFGVLHPHIHSDIAYHITDNWRELVKKMIPHESAVVP